MSEPREIRVDTRSFLTAMDDACVTIAGYPGTFRVKREDMIHMHGDFVSRFQCIMRNMPANAFYANGHV